MLNYKINEVNNPSSMVYLDETPMILTVYDSNYAPLAKGYAQITANTEFVEGDTITVNNHTITATTTVNNVANRYFYAGQGNYAAQTIVNALKSIGVLDMNYDIYLDSSSTNGVVRIVAKNDGIPTPTISSSKELNYITAQSGTYTYIGEYSTRAYVELFIDGVYSTTLSKEFYQGEAKFNLSPVLSTVCKHNKTFTLNCKMYLTVDDKYYSFGNTNNLYASKGYICNYGLTSLPIASKTFYLAENVSQGCSNPSFDNKSLKYIYGNNLTMSFYNNGKTKTASVELTYRQSDGEVITSSTQSVRLSGETLETISVNANESAMRNAYYLDVKVGDSINMRYNIINPPYANQNFQRVYYYNSYGGTSFFDFTTEETDERKYDYDTYNTSLLYYYTKDIDEQQITYNKNIDTTVSLRTHLIDSDGLYSLYDMARSKNAWRIINGKAYRLIITSLTVEEPNRNVYQATIKYKYSLNENLI